MHRYLLLVLFVSTIFCGYSQSAMKQGMYFPKKTYQKLPLPEYDKIKDQLPQPIYEENPLWIETYWQAWKIAFGNFYEPTAANGFVSQYIDAAFNNCIFLWDTAFMTMFCNYAHPLLPGIASLDNFYAKQYANGEIAREISRVDGNDCPLWVNANGEPLYSNWGYNVPAILEKTFVKYVGREVPAPAPIHTLDNFNHPIMAWAEMESFNITGDKERLCMVYEPLRRQYLAFQKYTRQGNGLYMVDWASMDNSARNKFLVGGGVGIDISCEMVLFANELARMALLVDRRCDVAQYVKDSKELSRQINKQMWNNECAFYCDLTLDGRSVKIKTVAAYWTLISGVANSSRSKELVSHLTNPATFGSRNLVPTLSADESAFSELGNYWCGSVWAPTTMMVIEGLERYGYKDMALRVALNHIALVANVYKESGSIWENYAPNKNSYGYHADNRAVAKNFVGWSGIAPIKLLIEYAVGLKANANLNLLEWSIASNRKIGCRYFRFNGNVISLQAEVGKSDQINVDALKPFTLVVNYCGRSQQFAVKKGAQTLILKRAR